MTTLDFGPTTTALATLVRGVRDEQLGGPTPNPGRSVGDLLDHIAGLALAFTAAARKEEPPGGGNPTADVSALPDDWRVEIPDRLAALADSWRDPAAYEGEANAGGVVMPGPIAASVALNEIVVHGWDLATAIGQPFHADDADVAACMAFAEPFSTPETADQRGDAFGPVVPVPDDAPALVRLLGMMGRRGR